MAPRKCHHCHASPDDLFKCLGCNNAYFCNEKCQRLAWPGHKKNCKAAQQRRNEEAQAAAAPAKPNDAAAAAAPAKPNDAAVATAPAKPHDAAAAAAAVADAKPQVAAATKSSFLVPLVLCVGYIAGAYWLALSTTKAVRDAVTSSTLGHDGRSPVVGTLLIQGRILALPVLQAVAALGVPAVGLIVAFFGVVFFQVTALAVTVANLSVLVTFVGTGVVWAVHAFTSVKASALLKLAAATGLPALKSLALTVGPLFPTRLNPIAEQLSKIYTSNNKVLVAASLAPAVLALIWALRRKEHLRHLASLTAAVAVTAAAAADQFAPKACAYSGVAYKYIAPYTSAANKYFDKNFKKATGWSGSFQVPMVVWQVLIGAVVFALIFGLVRRARVAAVALSTAAAGVYLAAPLVTPHFANPQVAQVALASIAALAVGFQLVVGKLVNRLVYLEPAEANTHAAPATGVRGWVRAAWKVARNAVVGAALLDLVVYGYRISLVGYVDIC